MMPPWVDLHVHAVSRALHIEIDKPYVMTSVRAVTLCAPNPNSASNDEILKNEIRWTFKRHPANLNRFACMRSNRSCVRPISAAGESACSVDAGAYGIAVRAGANI